VTSSLSPSIWPFRLSDWCIYFTLTRHLNCVPLNACNPIFELDLNCLPLKSGFKILYHVYASYIKVVKFFKNFSVIILIIILFLGIVEKHSSYSSFIVFVF
jgi:hypothetical protein